MVYDAANDDALARRAAAGCMVSFEQLVARFQVPLVHFLTQRTGSISDAEDLTQETMLRAYDHLRDYDPKRPFRTWLYTIARRLGCNHHRNGAGWSKRQAAHALVEVAAADGDPSHALCEAEQRDQLWRRASELLSEEKCSALWLFYVDDLPVREIARVVERSPGAVKTMLCRARKELYPYLARDPEFSDVDRSPTSSAQPILASTTLASDSEGD